MVAPVPAQISKLARGKLPCPSRRSNPNSCPLILLQTLLHSQSRQPLWNQANPNSFAKIPRFSFQPPTAHYPLPIFVNSFASYHIPANPAVSCDYALFCTTARRHPSYFQWLPHSFYRHGGVPFVRSDLPTSRLRASRPFDHQVYRMSLLLLVPSYFAELNRFCIPSPIVPVPPPGYTSTSLQEAFL